MPTWTLITKHTLMRGQLSLTRHALVAALMSIGLTSAAPVALAQTSPAASDTAQVSEILGSSLSELPDFGSNFSSFNLDNGLQVVVIPDHRAPVVTHMIWYKVGAADEIMGQSGIAHFLEHLMFKGTKAHPDGAFSKTVASIGGQENAFTSQDYTAYYQRVAKQHLGLMMELESDRMANLELREDQVTPELQVILEERASRIDGNPSALLGEALGAALYRNHPYGIPVIGWEHEMKTLNRQKAIDFYNLYYTPNNAVLVVAGDVTEEEVRDLAQKTYGKVARRAEPGERVRALEPPQRTARTLTLRHERVRQPSVRRSYVVPSDVTAKQGESVALDLLGYILGSGTNSRLYKSLVVEQKVATSAGAYYQSSGLNDTSVVLYGSPTGDLSLEDLMGLMRDEVDRLITDGVTNEEVARAKRSLLSESYYAQDNQAALARIVGSNLTSGSSLEQIKSWPKRLAAVTPEQVVNVARTYLQEHRSVTGYLLPPAPNKKSARTSNAPAAKKTEPMAAETSDKKMQEPAATKTVALPGPKAREMAKPKQAPRTSVQVPSPQSRPQGTPKPKPAASQSDAPATNPTVEG